MSREEDKYAIDLLIANDVIAIEDFFFNRCRAMLTYIGQYFCQSKESAESLIGNFTNISRRTIGINFVSSNTLVP